LAKRVTESFAEDDSVRKETVAMHARVQDVVKNVLPLFKTLQHHIKSNIMRVMRTRYAAVNSRDDLSKAVTVAGGGVLL